MTCGSTGPQRRFRLVFCRTSGLGFPLKGPFERTASWLDHCHKAQGSAGAFLHLRFSCQCVLDQFWCSYPSAKMDELWSMNHCIHCWCFATLNSHWIPRNYGEPYLNNCRSLGSKSQLAPSLLGTSIRLVAEVWNAWPRGILWKTSWAPRYDIESLSGTLLSSFFWCTLHMAHDVGMKDWRYFNRTDQILAPKARQLLRQCELSHNLIAPFWFSLFLCVCVCFIHLLSSHRFAPICPSRIRTVISIAYLIVAKAMQALNGQYEASFDGKAPKACVERLHFGQWGEDRPRPCWLCSFLKHCMVVELLFLVARFLGMIVLEAIRIITYIYMHMIHMWLCFIFCWLRQM